MKNTLIFARIAFCLLSLIVFFMVGIYAAILTDAAKGQMLAGGAIVLGWGVLFAAVSFIISIFIVRYFKPKLLVRVNWVLLGVLVIFYGITHYRFLERKKAKGIEDMSNTTSPVSLIAFHPSEEKMFQSKEMGIGFFQPNFYENPCLNFYGGVNLEKSISEHLPQDSVVFRQTELGFSTSYAPPWLFPEHMKLDYGIMMFKVIGYGNDFLKIETNRQTHQYHYADKSKGRFISWAEMLQSVNSIEPIDKSAQTIHTKPLNAADQISGNYTFLKPLLVQEEWIYVRLLTDGFKEVGKGWIRWKDGSKLLISYSLLS